MIILCLYYFGFNKLFSIPNSEEELVAMYNNFLTECLDQHAPWRNVRVRENTPHPWCVADIDNAREKKRKLENVWRRTKLESHRRLYVTACEECTVLISARKTDYYQKRLEKVNNKKHVSSIEFP